MRKLRRVIPRKAMEAARSVANSMTNGLTRLSAKRRIPHRGGCENDCAGVSACDADEESNCSIRRVKTGGSSDASLNG